MRPVLVDIHAGAADRAPHGRAVCGHDIRLTLRGALTTVAGLRGTAMVNRA